MKFNICLIKPEGYIHSLAFSELAELIHYSLLDLGHFSKITFNSIEADSKNIVIGVHLLNVEYISKIPNNSIILNTEQIYSDDTPWNATIFKWVRLFETWDYSERNIKKFKELSIENVKHLRLGYQRQLKRIQKNKSPDIDVLFYGSMNDRRRKIIQELELKKVNVKTIFGVYGKERDDLIARSKIVLNHHFYKSEIFEIVRVFYLLTNSIAVLGEVNLTTAIESRFLSGVRASKYDELTLNCIELINNEDLRIDLENKAFNIISSFPQKEFTSYVLN